MEGGGSFLVNVFPSCFILLKNLGSRRLVFLFHTLLKIWSYCRSVSTQVLQLCSLW